MWLWIGNTFFSYSEQYLSFTVTILVFKSAKLLGFLRKHGHSYQYKNEIVGFVVVMAVSPKMDDFWR